MHLGANRLPAQFSFESRRVAGCFAHLPMARPPGLAAALQHARIVTLLWASRPAGHGPLTAILGSADAGNALKGRIGRGSVPVQLAGSASASGHRHRTSSKFYCSGFRPQVPKHVATVGCFFSASAHLAAPISGA